MLPGRTSRKRPTKEERNNTTFKIIQKLARLFRMRVKRRARHHRIDEATEKLGKRFCFSLFWGHWAIVKYIYKLVPAGHVARLPSENEKNA